MEKSEEKNSSRTFFTSFGVGVLCAVVAGKIAQKYNTSDTTRFVIVFLSYVVGNQISKSAINNFQKKQ